MQIVSTLLYQALSLYTLLIFIYVIVTWVPNAKISIAIRQALGPIIEPFLQLFRRAIPAVSGVDFSPIIAILVLRIMQSLVLRLLG